MILQNNNFAGKSKIQRITGLIILMIVVVTTLLWNDLARDFGWFELPTALKITILLAAAIAYTLYNWLRYRKKYCFVYFTDEDKEHLVFRFYHIKLFGKKFTTYKIPMQLYSKYEVSHNKNIPELVLFQKTQSGKLAKYPPISLSAFNAEELNELTKALDSYVRN